MSANTDVTIIGAGPYGLSIASHLSAVGVDHRVIGTPMYGWSARMPRGMFLKSEGFASNIHDPDGQFTLGRFCDLRGLPYADIGLPVPLETFTAYGLDFQKRLVSEVESKTLVKLGRSPGGFLLHLDDGESFSSHSVVLALGLRYFQYIPPELAHLPSQFLSHSSDHSELGQFKNRNVVVIGGGSSAIDLASLLDESGAAVRLVARRPSIEILPPIPFPRSIWQRLRHPMSQIGFGWRTFFYAEVPFLFRYLPERIRLRAVKTEFGPASGWFMKDRVMGRIPLSLGCSPRRAWVSDNRVCLELSGNDSGPALVCDHIIAATGYRVDLSRLPFLGEELRSQLKSVEQAPVLSSHFESSVHGLYFVGPAAANTFGPTMRFASGARFAARRLSRHLAVASLRRT